MKSKSRSLLPIIIIVVLIYLGGLYAGLKTSTYIPSTWRKPDLEYYARQRLIEYEDYGSVYSWQHSGMAAVIYDAEGKFQDFFRMNGNIFTVNFVDQTEPDVGTVLSGKTTLRTYPFVRNLSKSGHTSFIYVGIPMKDDNGRITGAFFWVKEDEDLGTIMIGYAIIFTVMYLIISALMIFNYLNQRKNERLQRQYIDNITHDLKSPLSVIKALTEALSDGMAKDEDEVHLYYGMMLREVNRQDRMIKEALDLSRLQSSRIKPERTFVDPNEAFAEIIEKYRMHCELVDVDFSVDESFRKLDRVYTNVEYISQVLEMLLGNAIKFVKEGDSIRISAIGSTPRRVTVCIEDTGAGISKEHLPHIFERFYKADKSDRNSQGSGLGLAIAKTSLENLGEKIRIESKEGEGTRAYFTLSKGPGLFG